MAVQGSCVSAFYGAEVGRVVRWSVVQIRVGCAALLECERMHVVGWRGVLGGCTSGAQRVAG